MVPAAQDFQDPGIYGVIQSGDHKARTCVVKWVKLNAAGNDVEVFLFLVLRGVWDCLFSYYLTNNLVNLGDWGRGGC